MDRYEVQVEEEREELKSYWEEMDDIIFLGKVTSSLISVVEGKELVGQLAEVSL